MTDFHRMVHEITRPHVNVEAYEVLESGTWWKRRHRTTVPSLVDQLRNATPLTGTADDRAGTGYGSRPAGNLEALDTLAYIDLEAARWVRDLGEDDPADTAACISLLHGMWASAADVTQRAIEDDVRRWWTQARIVSGWDSPAWKPDNTCPLCGVRGSLRIKRTADSALCVDCRETWTVDTVSFLAAHIRAENGDALDVAG